MPKGHYKRTKKPASNRDASQGEKIAAGRNMSHQYTKAATICAMASSGLQDVVAAMAESVDVSSSDAPGLLIGLVGHLKQAEELLTTKKV